MGGKVEIDSRVFTPRRLTGRAQIDVTRAQAAVADAEDDVDGLEAEILQLGHRIDALSKADGEFDRVERDRLTAERKRLRGEQVDAHSRLVQAMAGLVIARCEPAEHDPDWIVDHLVFPDDYTKIIGGGDPPTSTGTSSE